MPLNIDEVIASAKLPEKTISLCLRGDLQAEWEDLERQLEAEEASDKDEPLAGNVKAQELAVQMEAVAAQMRGDEVVFRFRGLSSKAYSDLLAQHKADDTKPDEAVDGLNWQTYPTALIAACAVEPAMTLEQAERLSGAVTNRQWDDLFATALACNRSQVSVPFSLSASAIRASTGQSSKRPARGASPDPGSLDASLAG